MHDLARVVKGVRVDRGRVDGPILPMGLGRGMEVTSFSTFVAWYRVVSAGRLSERKKDGAGHPQNSEVVERAKVAVAKLADINSSRVEGGEASSLK